MNDFCIDWSVCIGERMLFKKNTFATRRHWSCLDKSIDFCSALWSTGTLPDEEKHSHCSERVMATRDTLTDFLAHKLHTCNENRTYWLFQRQNTTAKLGHLRAHFCFRLSSTRLRACGWWFSKKKKNSLHRAGALLRQSEHREGTHTRTAHTLNMREEALFIRVSRFIHASSQLSY